MKNNQRGITLISLSITIVVMLILAGILINVSVDEGSTLKAMNQVQEDYNNKLVQTKTRVNDMVNGWEDIIN